MSVSENQLEAHFWERVEKRGPDECWPWRPCKDQWSYGSIHLATKKTIPSTHIALALDGRPRPAQHLMALHSCDWPPCQNPAHLRWGTAAENVQDWVTRGRYRDRPTKPPQEPRKLCVGFGWKDMRSMNPRQKAEQLALRAEAWRKSQAALEAKEQAGTQRDSSNRVQTAPAAPQES